MLSTILSPAWFIDTNCFSYCTAFSRHTKTQINKVYAYKGYVGKPNRDYISINNIADDIMREDSATAKITDLEIKRNKRIAKVLYIIEQYFGIDCLHDDANRDRLKTFAMNNFDAWCRQAEFNVFRAMKILKPSG